MTEQNAAQDAAVSTDASNSGAEAVGDSLFDPIDEEITAYLDEELTDEERREFERRLESDYELKKRFETHRSAWNALDLLVDVPVNVDVTESTVERLNSETQTELTALNARKRRRNRLFLVACSGASLAFVILGYFLSSLFFPDVQKRRVADQNVISRLVQLEAIGDFEYLVELSRTDLFAKRSSQNVFSRNSKVSSSSADSQTPDDAGRSYDELSQDRSFYRLQQRFERLDESTRERWRLLWKKIETDPNRELLLKTLDDYSEWLANFANDEERERLQTESVSERIAEVRRQNEELARFWDRFPFRRQTPPLDASKPTVDGNTSRPQDQRRFTPFSPETSIPSTPFATQMLMLRNLLPEELRQEDFRSVYQKYENFRQNNGLDEKDADGILDFLKSNSNVYDSLSEGAKGYLASLSEEERRSALSLITALCVSEKNASDYYRQSAFRRPSNPSPYGFRMERNGVPFGNINRQNVSIRELANDLSNADSNVRDYITSRPAPEAQALLFGLHWGGGRMKFGFPPEDPVSTPTPLFPNVPFDLPPSRSEPNQRFDFPPSDGKDSTHMRQHKSELRFQD